MAEPQYFKKTITDPDAPARLRGLDIYMVLKDGDSLTFEANIPDDATDQEKAYLEQHIDELVSKLREELSHLIGYRRS